MVLISFDKDLPREEESLKEPKWHPIFRKLCKKRKKLSLVKPVFCKLNMISKEMKEWVIFLYQSIILYLMTILRYDDDTIHRNGCLFGAPAIRIIIIRGDLQPSLGNSDHKSLFSPYQNEHVGSMWKQLPLHCSSSPTHWCMYIIFSQ